MPKINLLLALSVLSLILVSGCTSHEISPLGVLPAPVSNYMPVDYPPEYTPTAVIYSPVIMENPIAVNPVKFYINMSRVNLSYAVFYPEMINDTIKGIKEWETATNGIIRFEESSEQDATMIVNFVRTSNINVSKGDYGVIFTSVEGEGGPTEAYSYRGFSLIKKSEIIILPSKENPCQTVETAAHETGHALGFGHDNNLQSIMFPKTSENCNRQILTKLTDSIRELYRNAKPDLRFTNVVVSQQGNFSITAEITNIGLAVSKETTLSVEDMNGTHVVATIPALTESESTTIQVNIQLTSNGTIKLYIDQMNDELNFADNVIEMKEE